MFCLPGRRLRAQYNSPVRSLAGFAGRRHRAPGQGELAACCPHLKGKGSAAVLLASPAAPPPQPSASGLEGGRGGGRGRAAGLCPRASEKGAAVD